jgi:23S rRNA pseudouridine1911/1915/1917 synthase
MVIAEDGKAARTHYRVLRQMPEGTSLAACRIEHGRTHQIRVHMASIGHPIVGDRLYGPGAVEEELAVPLMLHAWKAVLRQPFTGEEIRLEAPLPAWAEQPDSLKDLEDSPVRPAPAFIEGKVFPH